MRRQLRHRRQKDVEPLVDMQPAQRELVIDRLLALDVEDLTPEQVRWVVLMVLSSQPGQEAACARMETLVFDADSSAIH